MSDRKTEGWFRRLQDDRLEIHLKCGDRKVRASGPEPEMVELVEWFERKTGLVVNVPFRPGPRPIPGQLTMDELESEDQTQTEVRDGELSSVRG